GEWIVTRPLRVLVVAAVPIVLLAWQGLRLRTGLPRGGGTEWLPSGLEATTGLHDLEAMGRRGVVQTMHVLMLLPAGADVLTPVGWTAVRRMRELLSADARIASVHSFNSFATDRPLSRLTLFMTPRTAWRPFLSEDRRAVLLHAVPIESVDEIALAALVRRLRALDADQFTGIPGARIVVGGLPAARTDYVDAVSGQFGTVAMLVLLGTCVALFVGLRSLLVPLKAIALNLLAVGCGFGAVVLVFQDGWGLGLFGLQEPLETVFPILPTIVFCTVFGLSMDYEVFLVSRVAEARRHGMDDRAAIVAGLATTGPVITSAAAIMVTVFGAFMMGKFLLIQMLGLALAVAVFIDATLIRSAVGPALLTLAGRWNWWPGRTTPH
ncbi:MAG TPA: MMPL family transporter, partial [Gemmatimonadales bacterium]|nr:MMPL family transporter [Gemmatimonadales bacterium]